MAGGTERVIPPALTLWHIFHVGEDFGPGWNVVGILVVLLRPLQGRAVNLAKVIYARVDWSREWPVRQPRQHECEEQQHRRDDANTNDNPMILAPHGSERANR